MRENAELIANAFSFFGMYQHYPIHPGKGYTLDLAFSNLEEDSLVPADAAHHEPAFFSVNCGVQRNIEKVLNVLDFKKADYDH